MQMRVDDITDVSQFVAEFLQLLVYCVLAGEVVRAERRGQSLTPVVVSPRWVGNCIVDARIPQHHTKFGVVIQRDEIRYALWPDQWTKPVYCQNDFADLRKLNIFEIDGDYDLFNGWHDEANENSRPLARFTGVVAGSA
jgi:hypothetical protein